MGFRPYVMKNIDLVIGDEALGPNFKCQVRSAKLTPEVDVQRTTTACPTGQYAEVGDPQWTFEIGYLSGDDNGVVPVVEALAEFLLENAGEQLPVTFTPRSGEPDRWQFDVKIVPGAFGGEVGQFAEESVQLPVIGQPVKNDTPVGP